jgi:signal transduction histidine kinase
MADKQQPKAEPHAGGRVVYSRLHTEDEAGGAAAGGPAPSAGGVHLPGGREVEPMLPVLLGSFILLVALVFALGWLSESEVRQVSTDVQSREQQQALKTKYLLELRSSIVTLEAEALTRHEQLQRRDQQGDIIIPFEKRLGHARDEVQAQLPAFDRLPVAQTPQGRAFRQTLDRYVHATEDPRNYTLDAFTLLRDLDEPLRQFIAQSQHEQEDLIRLRLLAEQEAAARIRRLTFAAAALAVLVAALTVWELQRRFRELRASLMVARRERQFNAQMLEGMMSAVAALDAQARIRSANQSFFRLFPRAAVGASVYDQIADDEGMKLLAAATAARVERPTYHGRWLLSTDGANGTHNTADTDGTQAAARRYDVYSSPLNLDGEQGQILTLVDVTEAAATESELRHKTSLAAVGQAAAQVAHEIRNPLGSIRLGVAMLRDMTENTEAHNTIELVERGIAHLNKLTVDVTEFSRERELTLAEVNVNELLDASLELVADRLQAKQTTVERHYTDAPLTGTLDADQLRQVFVNLIANAVDASAEGAIVRLTTERTTLAQSKDKEHTSASGTIHAARITITDQGQGLDERIRAHLFEPFFTTKKRGTGLGLAIVKKIVEQHNGRVSVESTPGQGTSFHVELPLKRERSA